MHPIVEFLKEIDRRSAEAPHVLLETILRQCRHYTSAEAGTIFLVRPADRDHSLEPMCLQNDTMVLDPSQFIVTVDGDSISGYAAKSGETLLIENAYDIPSDLPYRFNTEFDTATGYRTTSIACVPLRRHNGDVGAVVQLINRKDDQDGYVPFDREQVELIAAAGMLITGVIDRAEMLSRLAEANSELKHRYAEIEALQMETEAALLEAEQSNRAKSEFLSCIGHELKTPLNAIIGFSDLLKNEGFGPLGHPSYKGFANDIADGGNRLLGIVEDILGIVTAESQQAVCDDDGPAAYGCIADICRAWFDDAAEKNILFAAEISDDIADCRINTKHLTTALDKLIDNAIKFTDAGGEIDVYAGPHPGGGLDIRISDTGLGMTQTDIIKALAPFGQADTSLSRGYEGAGLGLTLASALTRSMGGEFSVESKPDKGTTICLSFTASPRDRKVAATPVIQEPATAMWVSG